MSARRRWLASALLACLVLVPASSGAQTGSQGLPARFPIWAAGEAQGPAQYVSSWGSHGAGPDQFDTPLGIAADRRGQLYIADSANDRIKHIYPSGDLIGQWGTSGTEDGQFDDPCGVAVTPGGGVLVVDRGNARIQAFGPDGTYFASVGGPGSGTGEFLDPCGIAVDAVGRMYVADTGNDRVEVLHPDGRPLRSIGGTGSGPGRLESPMGVAFAPGGRVVVADTGNHRIQVFSATGQFLDRWGSGPGSGPGAFDTPTGVSVDVAGRIYVADSGNDLIQRFNASGQLLSWWGTPGSGDGQLESPFGVAVSRFGTVNVTDTGNHRFQRWGWPRPDAMIRRGASGRLVGNDVYNATGRNQSREARIEPGGEVRFLVILEDTGVAGGRLRLRGGGSTRQGEVTYRAGGADVTDAVVAGTRLTRHVPPYQRGGVEIRVRARPDAVEGAVIDRVLRATAAHGVGIDVVRFVVHVTGEA